MQPNGSSSFPPGVLPGIGEFYPNADVQTFIPTILSQDQPAGTAGQSLEGIWTKPKGISVVRVLLVGAGAGAGSGRKGASNSICCGGGASSSGSVTDWSFLARDLPNEVYVFAPCGGTGGVGVTANDTSGNPGSQGGSAQFGDNNSVSPLGLVLNAGGGAQGSGGTATTGAGGAASTAGLYVAASGASASTTGLLGNAGSATAAAAGGGSGGGLTSGNAHSNGGAGATPNIFQSFAIATVGGVAPGGAGSAGVNFLQQLSEIAPGGVTTVVQPRLWVPNSLFCPSCAGAGGASASSADAVSGGNGGNGMWGSGAGGGGAATDTTSPHSGYGGNGGDGLVIVISM